MHYFHGVVIETNENLNPDTLTTEQEGMIRQRVSEAMAAHLDEYDWYVIGGRWDGVVRGVAHGGEQQCVGWNLARVCEAERLPPSIVTPDGEWIRIADDWEKSSEGDEQTHKFYDAYREAYIVGVDFHG